MCIVRYGLGSIDAEGPAADGARVTVGRAGSGHTASFAPLRPSEVVLSAPALRALSQDWRCALSARLSRRVIVWCRCEVGVRPARPWRCVRRPAVRGGLWACGDARPLPVVGLPDCAPD